jgi:hypothetical protein
MPIYYGGVMKASCPRCKSPCLVAPVFKDDRQFGPDFPSRREG